LRRALAADPSVHAHTELLAKDSRLAMAMAGGAGLKPRLGEVAATLFAQACVDGLADQDDASLWHWLAESARQQG
jgi:3-hydroxyisobutyrate dehydrogenase-like beta-hydroxyacid dehydrogenase